MKWPRHIDVFERQYVKAFANKILSGTDLIDRIPKRVQVFLHSCNKTYIKDMKSGALAEFGGLQKKVERGDWFTTTLGWVDPPTPREEGKRKSEKHGSGSSLSGGGGGQDTVHSIVVDPQLRIMEKLGEITVAALLENLCCPLAEDGREICLQYHSNRECARSCTRSHAPLWGHSRDNVIRYIGIFRFALYPSRKRKFNGGSDQGYYGVHWNRNGDNRKGQNPYRQAHKSGAG